MSAAHDLKYYLDHADEMPTDPKEIERLANEHLSAALESGTEEMNVDTIVGKPEGETGATPGAKVEEAKPAEKPAEEAKPAAPADEAKPDGILAKDGKNVIPYSQLESARQRATVAENLARQQAEELQTLRAAKAKPAEQDAEMLTEEELQALEADSPTLAKTLRGQQAAIRQLTGKIEAVTQRQETQAVAEEQVVKSEIQTAIDANATLAAWQTDADQSLWNEASRIDKLLRESPKYADVTFADRFAKVVEMTRVSQDLEPERKEEVTLTPDEIKAAAQAKLKQVAKTSRPVSLSQIPGGAPPAVDEKEKVENMSAVALGQQFLGMTREQMDAYLASL